LEGNNHLALAWLPACYIGTQVRTDYMIVTARGGY
jgi:hypothetical protein